MRVMTMVTAACATAAAILGYQVLRRSRSARLVLTLLTVPLFLAGMVVGGFLPAVIVGSIIMLWFQPARDWIDGKTPRAVPAAPAAPPRPPSMLPPEEPPVAPSGPRAYPGFGERQGGPLDWPMGPPAYVAAPAGPARPRALMWACALAWTGSAVAFVVMLDERRGRPGRARHADRRALPPEPGAGRRRHQRLDAARDRAGRGLAARGLVRRRVGARGLRLARPALGLDRRCWSPRAAPRCSACSPRSAARRCSSRWSCAASPSRCCCGPRCAPSCAVVADHLRDGSSRRDWCVAPAAAVVAGVVSRP